MSVVENRYEEQVQVPMELLKVIVHWLLTESNSNSTSGAQLASPPSCPRADQIRSQQSCICLY